MAAVVALLTLVWWRVPEPGVVGATAPIEDWPSLPAPDPAALALQPEPARPTPLPGLVAAFETAADLRAFADAALRRTAEGGAFYALRALAECRRWSEAPNEPEFDIVAQRSHRELALRRAWADLANRRCAGFIADDLDDAQIERLLALGAAQRDPLLLAWQGWLEAIGEGEIEAIVAALAGVLRQGDPALLDWAALTGADYLDGSRGGPAPLDEIARRRRRDAWALLPCEFGADCARPELGAASRCIAAGLCLEGRRDAILFYGAWRSDAERAALAAEVAALARAAKAGDARAALGLPIAR